MSTMKFEWVAYTFELTEVIFFDEYCLCPEYIYMDLVTTG